MTVTQLKTLNEIEPGRLHALYIGDPARAAQAFSLRYGRAPEEVRVFGAFVYVQIEPGDLAHT